jgi:hypothetical protein
MTGETTVVDFHNHHIPARFELTATLTQPATQRARWEMLARKLRDEDLLLRDIREGHLVARVVNIPGNLIADENGHVPHQTIKAINDNLAELAARHPGRIYGLDAAGRPFRCPTGRHRCGQLPAAAWRRRNIGSSQCPRTCWR